MIKSAALPSRTIARIGTALCRVCFCAVPADQTESHEAWHKNQVKMRS